MDRLTRQTGADPGSMGSVVSALRRILKRKEEIDTNVISLVGCQGNMCFACKVNSCVAIMIGEHHLSYANPYIIEHTFQPISRRE